jgi:hypothetical protein
MGLLRRLRSYLVLAFAGAVASVLASQGIALAQQGPTLVSYRAAAAPLDPSDAAWGAARAIDIPLTPQNLALPRLDRASIPTVRVRSLHDDQRIAFLLEWQDPSRDAHANKPDQFRDAAALLFSLTADLPNICMGAPGQLTNLWHWKADWQEDIDIGFQEVPQAYPNFFKDVYPFVSGQPPYQAPQDFSAPGARAYMTGLAAGNPLSQFERISPVEELLSAGFGTASHKSGQSVAGKGAWANGRWRVVFARPLQVQDNEAAPLVGRTEFPFAVAVWNGSNQEVGARKQLSSFLTLQVSEQERAGLSATTWFALGGVMAIIVVAAAVLLLRRRAQAAGSAAP